VNCTDDRKRDPQKKKGRLRVIKVLKTVYSFVQAREQLALDKLGVLGLRTKRNTEHADLICRDKRYPLDRRGFRARGVKPRKLTLLGVDFEAKRRTSGL
jgi:hypothetical protein